LPFQIAMLDLLWSYAHIASLMNYTRPEFSNTLAIKGGKHPYGLPPVARNGERRLTGRHALEYSTSLTMASRSSPMTSMRRVAHRPSRLSRVRSESSDQPPLSPLEADFTSRRFSMSGKTTYLMTIALISVQAMIGSFVPAEYASVPLHDALLTRLSNDDNLTGCVLKHAPDRRTMSF
jgi:DNA mismatch repair protein MSH4